MDIKSLEKQFQEDNSGQEDAHYFRRQIIELLEIEERGGGSEGIYYTHKDVEGEYLLRNLHFLVRARLKELNDLWEWYQST